MRIKKQPTVYGTMWNILTAGTPPHRGASPPTLTPTVDFLHPPPATYTEVKIHFAFLPVKIQYFNHSTVQCEPLHSIETDLSLASHHMPLRMRN